MDGLPNIGIKSPHEANFQGRNQSFKTPTNASNNRPKLRNNLMNHNKNMLSYDVPKFGNLMKLNTLENEATGSLNNTEANFMNNKKYADLRISAGKKKVIPDKYVQKVIKPTGTTHAEEVESVPSELGNDQWAEINNYDY